VPVSTTSNSVRSQQGSSQAGTADAGSAMTADVHNTEVRSIYITFFKDEFARTLEAAEMTLWDLRDLVLSTNADKKSDLRLLKLAKFGPTPSENDCLRYNDNVISISGVVVEHDAGTMSVDEAANRLRKARLTALTYTSPSHTVKGPRWRVVCPTSCDLPPEQHAKLVARINGVLGGKLSPESFTLSQPYYFGSVRKNPAHRAEYTSGDFIDLRDDLDEEACDKNGAPYTGINDKQHEPNIDLLADDPGMVAAALEAIPIETDWIERNYIGMATWGATNGSEEGFKAWDAWLQRSGKYDASATRKRWRALSKSRPTHIGMGTLDHLAKQAVPSWRDVYEARRMGEMMRDGAAAWEAHKSVNTFAASLGDRKVHTSEAQASAPSKEAAGEPEADSGENDREAEEPGTQEADTEGEAGKEKSEAESEAETETETEANSSEPDEKTTEAPKQEGAKPNGGAPPQGDGPIPLFPPLPPAIRFPVEALGTILSKAALAIARKVQAPAVIAAQSVLAVAALAAQALASVQLPFGQSRPLSLFFITVAASGDRKTTIDREALWPIRKREEKLREIYDAEFKKWDVAYAAWSAQRKKIERDNKLDIGQRVTALNELGPKPLQPLSAFLTTPEPTVEGLIKAWVLAPATLGIFSAEGGQFIGGYGMSQDHRLKTAAALSGMWDGAQINRLRAVDDVHIILNGRVLSLHLMVQPHAAATFVSDPILRDQGLLSRILVAEPESIAGTRLYRNTKPADEKTIQAYSKRILSLLEAPWPIVEGTRNELDPPPLVLDAEAFAAWKDFYDRIERRSGANSELAAIGDFAAKSAEHAARIAGVLTVVDDRLATEIKGATMRDAITIADWYVNEAVRLQVGGRTDPKLVRAQRLLDWLQQRGTETDLRDIIRFGPAAERSKAAAIETLLILLAHGWVRVISKRPYRVAVVQAQTEQKRAAT